VAPDVLNRNAVSIRDHKELHEYEEKNPSISSSRSTAVFLNEYGYIRIRYRITYYYSQ
jgi:hypothetical protein